jgi:hypothetical protein
MYQGCVLMTVDPQPLPGKFLADIEREQESPIRPTSLSKTALIERMPLSLSYAANLEPCDRAVLFYDSLVAAAEYFCAYMEEGIRRHETTCFTGLSAACYRSLFEQVGISVAEMENCGYLRNLSTADFYRIERWNKNGIRRNSELHLRREPHRNSNGIRFVHVHGQSGNGGKFIESLLETERGVHVLSSFPATSICCYDAKLVLEDVPSDFFGHLLQSHNHCFFQGVALPTSRLLDAHRGVVYPNVRST